jgi:hypothetical protein
MTKTWVMLRTCKELKLFSSVPPQTGQPINEPPRAARGSSMVAKNGGTLMEVKIRRSGIDK